MIFLVIIIVVAIAFLSTTILVSSKESSKQNQPMNTIRMQSRYSPQTATMSDMSPVIPPMPSVMPYTSRVLASATSAITMTPTFLTAMSQQIS